jgi:type I restriction-modification system DNA methylase subunit
VYAYNGGLFIPDEILDTVQIDDELLYRHTFKLSEYDFVSEVDVNILGHIFENSLNELDEIKAQLDGQEVDKTKTRRKKDGIFYTPKYITKYIVDQTIGKLCIDKKAELLIVDEDYFTDKKRSIKTKQPLAARLTEYRNWLLQLTICDPACGSGAFLNQALDFLINEHRYIDELHAKLFGDSLVLSDIEKGILEHNLFGVDLNDESVEIAKLSLWLRTAQPNRKLNDLNNNIKCGNSLIDDPAVAGDKAFNWNKEFPQVFEKGGFDVVIGNPPYGASFNEVEKAFISKFETYKYRFESYVYFYEKGITITKKGGYLGFITPEIWLNLENCKSLRKFIFTNSDLVEIHIIGEAVFAEAVVNTVISILCKEKTRQEFTIINKGNSWNYPYETWGRARLLAIEYRISLDEQRIFERIEKNSSCLENLGEVIQGITPYDKYRGQDSELIKKRGYHYDYKKDSTCGKWLNGEDVTRFTLSWSGEWLSYGEWLAAPREKRFFEGNRLVFREIPGKNKRIQAALTDEVSYYGNLKLPNFGKEIFPKLNPQDIKMLPISNQIGSTQLPFIDRADRMLLLNKDLHEVSQKFQRSIQRKFAIEVLPNKLQDWYLLTYAQFIAELGKKKVKLSLSEEAEWEGYFVQESKKALELKSKIETTDKEIDRMVYQLYELTEEEIRVVEGQ